jgi:ketosteroid isomerase-like protein
VGALADHVRSYYAALNTTDTDRIAAHFTDDATHYYTRRDPHVGARAIAENAVMGVEHLKARWRIEHLVEGDDEVVIEWTMAFDHPRERSRRLLDRGAEFIAFENGLIREIRAYYDERGGDLRGFDHAERGHTTL